jgi:hypothetical protein
MNILKTDRTYATAANAVKALVIACTKIGKDIADVRYVIAVNEFGRFAPVVVGHDDAKGWTNNDFIFQSITWVG